MKRTTIVQDIMVNSGLSRYNSYICTTFAKQIRAWIVNLDLLSTGVYFEQLIKVTYMMKSPADTPIYNLKAVVQETGLKPDTLRAWERRYGLPAPQRTDSGHRLYSQNDIELLKWLMARQEEGLNISRAVELWRQLEHDQESSLQTTMLVPPPAHSPAPARVGGRSIGEGNLGERNLGSVQSGEALNTLERLRNEWITSCLNFDEQHAEQSIAQAFALFPAENVCLDILQKGLATIGRGWYENNITVQQEHFASALALRRLEALLAATPSPTRAGRILIGCPPEEVHTFVPLMLTLLLRRRSWDVLFLGANVPVQDFIVTTQKAKPQLVVLTAQLLYTAMGLRELGESLYEARIPMGYGGLVFTQIPAVQQSITGHYLGDHLEEAIHVIEELMLKPRLAMPADMPSRQATETLDYFRLHQAEIESEVWRKFGNGHLSHSLLRKANINFSRDIIAALALGDIHYLGIDLPWVKGLLKNHYQLPESVIHEYLQAYLTAAENVLNDKGVLLISWLKQILQKDVVTSSL